MNIAEHFKEKRQTLDKVKRYAKENFGYTYLPFHQVKQMEPDIVSKIEATQQLPQQI